MLLPSLLLINRLISGFDEVSMDFTILIMIVVMAGMMFFTSRQQKKQAENRRQQLAQLNKGDQVVTIGGLLAIVDEVNSANRTIVLDVDGVYLTFELDAIKKVLASAEIASVEEQDSAVEEA